MAEQVGEEDLQRFPGGHAPRGDQRIVETAGTSGVPHVIDRGKQLDRPHSNGGEQKQSDQQAPVDQSSNRARVAPRSPENIEADQKPRLDKSGRLSGEDLDSGEQPRQREIPGIRPNQHPPYEQEDQRHPDRAEQNRQQIDQRQDVPAEGESHGTEGGGRHTRFPGTEKQEHSDGRDENVNHDVKPETKVVAGQQDQPLEGVEHRVFRIGGHRLSCREIRVPVGKVTLEDDLPDNLLGGIVVAGEVPDEERAESENHIGEENRRQQDEKEQSQTASPAARIGGLHGRALYSQPAGPDDEVCYPPPEFRIGSRTSSMESRTKKVVVVLPAYNAEKTLRATLDNIPRDCVDDILLVDDCSRDRTVEVARELGLRTIVHPRNRGYGGNQKTCYRTALDELAGDVVVMVHPDHQYDPTIIPQLIQPLLNDQCDAVFGSRMLGGRPIEGGMPKWKYFANLFLTMVENATFYIFLSEYHSGFRAYSRRYLESVDFEANSDNFVFDTEIIAQGVAADMLIREVPIQTRYFDEASQIGFWRSVRYGLEILKTMVLYKLHRKRIWSHPIFRHRPVAKRSGLATGS